MASKKRIVIIGAAGRDFHNFNMLFRDNPDYEVVAFTAAQIPFIEKRTFPKELAGKLYKADIPIYSEERLRSIINKEKIDACIMSYSDLKESDVMHKASLVNAAGADFELVAPEHTMLKSTKPVIAVCAVRTGCGKSQVSRYIAMLLKKKGKTPIVIRHPMPYGDLVKQNVQRFATLKDLDKHKTTIEEREDYEPHIRAGTVVYAGVDYGKILKEAEKEADVIIWDGGNNDAPFIKPDLFITVADPLRTGDELNYYPGETVARMADMIIVNKANSASQKEIDTLLYNLREINADANIVLANSAISVDSPSLIKGKSVVVVEDGPTVTHGNMKFGAATVAVKKYGAKSVVEPVKLAVGIIKDVYKKYAHLSKIVPAVGYSPKEVNDLRNTLNRIDCDSIVSATPTDLTRIMELNKPVVRVYYELEERDNKLTNAINAFVKKN